MSLFICGLAFATNPEFDTETKLGVILGSTLSTLAGAPVLSRGRRREARPEVR